MKYGKQIIFGTYEVPGSNYLQNRSVILYFNGDMLIVTDNSRNIYAVDIYNVESLVTMTMTVAQQLLTIGEMSPLPHCH